MNNESFTPKELHDAEMLDTAIDSLRQQRTKVQGDSSSLADIDPMFEQRLHTDLVKRFSYTRHSPWKLWKLFGIPTATMAVLVVGVMAAMKPELFTHKQTQSTAGTAVAQTNSSTNSTATNTAHSNTNSGSAQQSTTNTNTAIETGGDALPTIEGDLAQIEPDMTDINTINADMQSAMDSVDDILDSIDSLDSLNTDTSSASTEIDQLPL